jgi:hypothetical protein
MVYLHVQHHDIGDIHYRSQHIGHHLNDQIAVTAWNSCEIYFAAFGHVQ